VETEINSLLHKNGSTRLSANQWLKWPERGGGSEFNKGWEKYRGSGGRKSPSGVQGQSPGGGPQKLETYAKSRTVKTSNKCNTRKTVNKLLLLTFLLSTLRLQTRKTELSWKLEVLREYKPLVSSLSHWNHVYMIAVTAPMKTTNNLICHTTASVCLTHRFADTHDTADCNMWGG